MGHGEGDELPEHVIPRANYQRAADRKGYDAGLKDWDCRPYTNYWRLVWRNMVQSGHERTLRAALIPPGAAHIHSVSSLATNSDRGTVLVGGLWASIPFDYLVKVSSKPNISDELIKRFPAPVDHPGAALLLLRALRLNCLTRDYEPLWERLYESGFTEDRWTAPFQEWPQLGVAKREWTWDTPLRSDFERRAALVEIDSRMTSGCCRPTTTARTAAICCSATRTRSTRRTAKPKCGLPTTTSPAV